MKRSAFAWLIVALLAHVLGAEPAAAPTTALAKTDKKDQVTSRGKRDTSMMPIELADKLSPEELASLIAYLESLTLK